MNERTNLKEVTEYINRLLEEVINTNDFQSFDETLAVIAHTVRLQILIIKWNLKDFFWI